MVETIPDHWEHDSTREWIHTVEIFLAPGVTVVLMRVGTAHYTCALSRSSSAAINKDIHPSRRDEV